MTESTTGERRCGNCGALWGMCCCPNKVLHDPWIGINPPGRPHPPGHQYPDSGGIGVEDPPSVPRRPPVRCQRVGEGRDRLEVWCEDCGRVFSSDGKVRQTCPHCGVEYVWAEEWGDQSVMVDREWLEKTVGAKPNYEGRSSAEKVDSPTVSANRGDRNSAAIRAVLTILSDLKQLGHLNYCANSSASSDGAGVLHKNYIEIAYCVEKE